MLRSILDRSIRHFHVLGSHKQTVLRTLDLACIRLVPDTGRGTVGKRLLLVHACKTRV